jgi:hypothetical protein
MKKRDKTEGEKFTYALKQQNTARYEIFAEMITNGVAPFGLIASDRRFGEMHCLRLLGKG